MTKVFSEELERLVDGTADYYSNAPKTKEYFDEVNKVLNKYEPMIEKQRNIDTEINSASWELLTMEAYKKENPEMVLDPNKMKEHKTRKSELQEQIEELEMLRKVDFKLRQREEIKKFEELRKEAYAEYNEYVNTKYQLSKLIEVDSNNMLKKLNAAAEGHPLIWIKYRQF